MSSSGWLPLFIVVWQLFMNGLYLPVIVGDFGPSVSLRDAMFYGYDSHITSGSFHSPVFTLFNHDHRTNFTASVHFSVWTSLKLLYNGRRSFVAVILNTITFLFY